MPKVDPVAKAQIMELLLRHRISIDEAAARLNVSVRTIKRYVADETRKHSEANEADDLEVLSTIEGDISGPDLRQLVAVWYPQHDSSEVLQELDREYLRAVRIDRRYKNTLPAAWTLTLSLVLGIGMGYLNIEVLTGDGWLFAAAGIGLLWIFLGISCDLIFGSIYRWKYPNARIITGLNSVREILRQLGDRNPWKPHNLPYRDRRTAKRERRALAAGLAVACHTLRDSAWLGRSLELQPARDREVTARSRCADELAVVEGLLHIHGPHAYPQALNSVGLVLYMSCLRNWNLHQFTPHGETSVPHRSRGTRFAKKAWLITTGASTVAFSVWGQEIRSMLEESLRYVRVTAVPEILKFVDQILSAGL